MGGRSAPDELEAPPPPPVYEATWVTALSLSGLLFLGLLVNVRPIGAGDTRATEHVAASLVEHQSLDLDSYPQVEPPFARMEGAHRVSIYPVLSAILATPVFAVCRLIFALDETGSALAGKIAASLFSALAAGFLFLALSRRHPERDAALCAVVFVLGTSVWSTSQALWQHPAAVMFLCLALLFLVRAEEDSVWAARMGLPLSLALAARHADVALVTVLGLGDAIRYPRRILGLVLWGAPAMVLLALYQAAYFGSPFRNAFSDSLSRFSETWGVGQLGLLVSPGKGLFVFTPVVLVALYGLVRHAWHGERFLGGILGLSALAHLVLLGRWSEWHGGESFGPRMMTDALPCLLFYLPEGWTLLPEVGTVLAALSIFVQVLGAFAFDDYRWERLYQRPPALDHAELWNLPRSPIPFYTERRVVIPAAPLLRSSRIYIREHPIVLFSKAGSRVAFAHSEALVSGSEPILGDVYATHGARVSGNALALLGRWDGLFFRVREEARIRRLELRLRGRGSGTIFVGETNFWRTVPVWTPYVVNGPFRIVHPYYFPESGGPDLEVTVGKGGGQATLELVALLPHGDPDQPIQAP